MYLVQIFALLFGLSYGVYTEKTQNACYDICPAGYHKIGNCADRGKPHRCGKCGTDTFTDMPSIMPRCHRCSHCRHLEVVAEKCSVNSDTKCDCPKGYYYFRRPKYGDCKKCPLNGCSESDDHKDCKRKCESKTSTLSAHKDPSATQTGPSTVFTTSTTTETSDGPEIVQIPLHSMHWFYLVAIAIVTLLVLSWLLLLNRNPPRDLTCCPCSDTNKDLELPVEDPKIDEQHSHQGCNPTTVTFTISERTPMMLLSQSPVTEDHPTPAHISPLEPNTEWKVSRQDERSERWPAIVLYAIIKEVPLRRWKEFLRLLSVADQQLERVELEAGFGLGSIEKQYQMLRLWSQHPSANLSDVFSALHYMNLSGCAQLLQESLEYLEQRT